MITNEPVAQIAYVVPDIREACLRHARLFGTGPFFVASNIPLSSSRYRGRDVPFNHSSAFGQWGDVMIEFMQREDDQPSVLTDVLDRTGGRAGMHHKAILVADPPAVAARFEESGFPIAFHGTLTAGVEVFMVDTLDLYGHMIELYAPSELVRGFFAMVRDAAASFDGTDILRDFAFG